MKLVKIDWMVPIDQNGNNYNPDQIYRLPPFHGEEFTEKSYIHHYLCRVVMSFGDGHEAYSEIRVSPGMKDDADSSVNTNEWIRQTINRRLSEAVHKKLNELWVVSGG